MQDRKEETPVKWGKRGLGLGAGFGAIGGAATFNVDQLRWNAYKQQCIKTGRIPYTLTRPHVIPYVAIPLIATAAFLGGVGYTTGVLHDKIQYPVNQSVPSKPEKWASNGFKVGAGFGLSGAAIVNHIARTPGSSFIKNSVGTSLVGGLLCAGVGLFAGSVATKLQSESKVMTTPKAKM